MLEILGQRPTDTKGRLLSSNEIAYLELIRNTPNGETLVIPESISRDRALELMEMEVSMGSHYEAINGYRGDRPRDKQVGGDHYSKHTIQPVDIIREYNMDFFEGNALKYLLRYKSKNGVQDLEKAKDYIDMIIDNLKENK